MTDDPWHAHITRLGQALDRLETRVARRTADLEACMAEVSPQLRWPGCAGGLSAQQGAGDGGRAHRPGGLFVGLQPCWTAGWRWTTWDR
jgi:hypothetical protein